jgi:hypothetical protein
MCWTPDKGYFLNHKGTNGFSCIVERTEQERADFRNDVYAAVCFDAEGSEKILPVWMDAAKMRGEGRLSPMEVKQEIARRYENGTFRPPSRAGISYMIAPLMRTYPQPRLAEPRSGHDEFAAIADAVAA